MNILNYEMLNLLEKDPLLFQQHFVDQLLPFYPYENTTQKKIGKQFHLLMQQVMMGLPIEAFLQNYPDMAHWVQQLQAIISYPAQSKQYNVSREMLVGEWCLVANYDLLIETNNKIIAVDWTTQKSIPTSEQLEQSWKTQLKMFLIAETENIAPEKILLSYYFVNQNELPYICQFHYGQQEYSNFVERLNKTLSNYSLSNNKETQEADKNYDLDEHQINLQKFMQRKISVNEYLETIPEVQI